MKKATRFQVVSLNFSWHQPVEAESFEAALTIASARGFEANIYEETLPLTSSNNRLVCSWSPLYGVKFHGNFGMAVDDTGRRLLVVIPSRAS